MRIKPAVKPLPATSEILVVTQTPDDMGRVIPLEAETGRIAWSSHGSENKLLDARSEQISFAGGVASTYSCSNCCPDSVYQTSIVPVFTQLAFGESTQFLAQQTDITCASGIFGPYEPSVIGWSTNNPTVASVFDGLVSGDGVGTADISVVWESCLWWHQGDGYCEPVCDQTLENAQVEVVGVQKIQYKGPNNTDFADATGTLYVLKDTQVTFKAVPNPVTATFPSGQLTWSGTSGATGTGATVSVTFGTVSSSTTNFKTVVATSGNSSVTVNVVVYELTGTLTPQHNFSDRSVTDYGLKEIIDLAFTASPSVTVAQAGGLTWSKKSGVGTVTPASGDVGTGTYDAEGTVGTVKLALKIVDGPSKNQELTVDRNVIAPNDATMTQTSGTGIRHQLNYIHVGFKGTIRLRPTNVSFANIHFREGSVLAVASGCWAFENGANHPPTSGPVTIGSCNNAAGCLVNGTDTIECAAIGPYPAPPPTPSYCSGDFSWAIPWQYSTNNGMNWTTFTTATHHHWADTGVNLGRARIEKKGAGPFSKHATDATSNY